MGTSADYSAPPNWGDLKGIVTRRVRLPSLSDQQTGELLRDYVRHGGGSSAISRGTGQLGSGETAKSIARNFGGFARQVSDVGLDEALRQNGLQEFVGRSAQETLLGILSHCGGTDGAIDSVDARSAFSRTMDELCRDTDTADEVEAALGTLTDSDQMANLLMSFFANYLYEQFCRVFYAQLVQKVGEAKAESFLGDIRDYIRSRLDQNRLERDVTAVDWFGREGNQLATRIMQDTLIVFES